MFLWQVIEAQVDMPSVGAITLFVSLLTFALRVHPDRLDYVDQVLVCLLNLSFALNFDMTTVMLLNCLSCLLYIQ